MGKASDHGHTMCPTLRPTKEQFEKPFTEYVQGVFRRHPNWACFKVIPPKGWTPRKRGYDDLADIQIGTPIKQHAFGRAGAYMCILEEQKPMNVETFQKMATLPANRAPKKGHSDDSMLERSFWSGVTLNPPLYGADTPTSLFDARLPWGWNLRNLRCLLKDYNVPNITGVTTPMTYFGMWKSFFGWHKEDLDLMSVNYLHTGAPKVWYAVAPSDAAKFDSMAKSLFPEPAAACPAFMRHKDVIISPKVLKSFNVPFVQARQRPGEFIVLNSAAYHAGFNLGFNCAEAVNFALPAWMEVGRDCVSCECGALPDSVKLDMSIFFPDLYDTSSSEEEESDGEEISTDEDNEEQEVMVAAVGKKRKAGARQMTTPQQKKRNQNKGRGRAEEESEEEEEEADGKVTRGNEAQRAHRPSPPRIIRTPQVPEVAPSARGESLPRGAVHVSWGNVAESRPVALIEKDPATKQLSFNLIHRLEKKTSKPGSLWVGLLREEEGGIFTPTGATKLAQLSMHYPKLMRVRVEWAQPEGRVRRGGWKLITTRKRILM